jgi:hypothetical protein
MDFDIYILYIFSKWELTNATVIDDAIRFVSSKSKENLKSSANDNEHGKGIKRA